jgi:hypothetical protein
MKFTTLITFVFLLLLSFNSFAQTNLRSELGSVESVLSSLVSQNIKPSSVYFFKTASEKQINVNVEDYYFENGSLSMTGKAQDVEHSLFILKGDNTSLYGYMILYNSDIAYEYTTRPDGLVEIEEVPASKLVPDLYFTDLSIPEANTGVREVFVLGYSPMALGQTIHIGQYANQNLLKLESRPNSKYVFYLDISRIMNGDVPKHLSKEQIYILWQCVVDQYSMYDINITTNPAVYAAAGVPRSGIIRFIDSGGRSFAPLNSFGTTSYGQVFRKPDGYDYGRTAAHEIGHQMGLSHDGGAGDGEYSNGLSAFQWCPIMGNFRAGTSWNNALFQYSKGEYNSSSQKQDDLIIVKRYVPFNPDDIPTTKTLIINGDAISPRNNWGQINQNTDSDVFTFQIQKSGGHLTLKIDPIEFLRMLDVDAKIVNSSGTTVAQNNLSVNRSAQFDLNLPEGSYQLIIKGGAEGTPQNGFSNYSSMGFYAMEGKLTGGIISDILFNNNSVLGLEVYPNPTNGIVQLNFTSPVSDNYVVRVENTLGQLVYSKDLTNYIGKYSGSLDLTAYGKGMYFVFINSSEQRNVKRIIVE